MKHHIDKLVNTATTMSEEQMQALHKELEPGSFEA